MANDSDLRKALHASVDDVNADLAPLEKVRRFMIADEPFTTENEMATPTLKIRRHKVNARYGDAMEALYEKGK